MACSSSVTEAEVGISCFTSSLPGFRGCVDAKEDKKAAPAADADHSKALELFSGLCGEADCRALRGLLGKFAASGEGELSPIMLSPDADKANRSVGFVPRR
ncbi:hypothetical protein ZWY2020_036675 [Hordeum vulgare]|nr:hypothetical protein ZWY2020_036675 [Hordeum vulgare]